MKRSSIRGGVAGVVLGMACGLAVAAQSADPRPQRGQPDLIRRGPPAGSGERVHLFILSGQSNMVGLDPNVSFVPALTNAFPRDTVLVVQDASSGRPIRDWYVAPAGNMTEARRGPLYVRLMGKVKAALTNAKPDTVTFVWMQGEADGHTNGAPDYRACLAGLVAFVRADVGRPIANVVIGRISDYANNDPGRPNWLKVREAEVAVAEADVHAAWVDTDDLNGKHNALHYGPEGYRVLGRRFAEKAIALINRKE